MFSRTQIRDPNLLGIKKTSEFQQQQEGKPESMRTLEALASLTLGITDLEP